MFQEEQTVIKSYMTNKTGAIMEWKPWRPWCPKQIDLYKDRKFYYKNLPSLKDLSIYSVNARSLPNKKVSLQAILKKESIDIGFVSEINTKNPDKFPGYNSFKLISKKKFHGMLAVVHGSIANNVIRIPHNIEEFEIIHLQFQQALIPLNIIGVYLDVEGRTSVDDVKRVHSKLQSIIQFHLDKQEQVICLGDCNRNPFVTNPSAGTKLLLDWLKEGEMIMLNDNTPTRIDPATKVGTTLDLCLVSKTLSKNVDNFLVDINEEITPFNKHKKPTDHRALLLKIGIPIAPSTQNRKYPVINFSNKKGWEKYKEISDECAPEMESIIRENNDVDTIERKLGFLEQDMLVRAFGIIWRSDKKKHKRKENKEIKALFEEQVGELEEALDIGASGKDLNNKVFRLRNLINGTKANKTECQAILDPTNGDLITNHDEIKRISLEHNQKILKKNKPRKEDIPEIEQKYKLHEKIMNKTDYDAWELDKKTFDIVCKKIKDKNKNMFKSFNNAGNKYKDALYLYMKKIIELENIPSKFWLTELIQIWKKKGSPLDLNNFRFIHMRSWHCKLLEGIITEKMKPDIISATPKIQLGGRPGCSSVEHLVVLKTWIKMKEETKKPAIFQTFDMQKFFDRESLLDCMNSLSTRAKIDNKSYRIWFKINEKTNIAVRTSVGKSQYRRIFDSIGQGQDAAALVSALNLGCDIDDIFKDDPSTKIGQVPLNSIIFQDDIGKMNDGTESARKGAEQIDNVLKRKLLSVNYDKSKYLVFGTKKQKAQIDKELSNNPITMGGFPLSKTSSEAYLGDIISDQGCNQSITETIAERIRKLRSRCDEIIETVENPLMGTVKSSAPAIRLYEAQIIPALLNNCESWIGIKDKHIEELQKFQDEFLRKVLRVHVSTTKAILHWDTGLAPMKWRILQKKLLFIRKVIHVKDHTSIVKQVIYNEIFQEIKGLAYECKNACDELAIDNILVNKVKPGMIKRAILSKIESESIEDMLNSVKVADRMTENKADNTYMYSLSLPETRIWFRYRARAIKGVKANFKRSHTDLQCRFCNANVHETQEHLEMCEGTAYERRGLGDLGRGWWKDLLVFWRRMTVKLTAAGSK